MNKRILWIYELTCAVMLTGCSTSTVKVIKPVDVSGTDIQLPVSSLAFTSGDAFTPQCRQTLDATADPNLSTRLVGYRGDFQRALEKALTASGFTFSTGRDKVYIRLKVAGGDFWVIQWRRQEGMVPIAYGLRYWVTFQIEYLDVKGRTLGVIEQCYRFDNPEQAVEEVAEFTRTAFGARR